MRRNYRYNNQSYNRTNKKCEPVESVLQANIDNNILDEEIKENTEQYHEVEINTENNTEYNTDIKTECNTEISSTDDSLQVKEKIYKLEIQEAKINAFEKEMTEEKEDDTVTENRNTHIINFDTDRDILLMNKERYEILASERPPIFHPEFYGISPVWANDPHFQYKCIFELKDHQLFLKSFQVTSDRTYPIIHGIKPEVCNFKHGLETVQYLNVYEPIQYTGAIMFANSFIKDYRTAEQMETYNPPCFCYKHVGELIFDEGKLITSVNHNKAMRRIRKNLDLGLRSLNKKQDVKCIKKFIKASFIGDYHILSKGLKKKRNDHYINSNMRKKEVHIMYSKKKEYLDKIKTRIQKLRSI